MMIDQSTLFRSGHLSGGTPEDAECAQHRREAAAWAAATHVFLGFFRVLGVLCNETPGRKVGSINTTVLAKRNRRRCRRACTDHDSLQRTP